MHLVSWVRFVEFSEITSAEGALETLQVRVLGWKPIRISWKEVLQTNKQMQHAGWVQIQQPDPNQLNGAYYACGYAHTSICKYAQLYSSKLK